MNNFLYFFEATAGDTAPVAPAASATNSRVLNWGGGPGIFTVDGTFGGATATLQRSQDGTTFTPVGVAVSAAGSVKVELPVCSVRVAISAGAPVGLKARLLELTN